MKNVLINSTINAKIAQIGDNSTVIIHEQAEIPLELNVLPRTNQNEIIGRTEAVDSLLRVLNKSKQQATLILGLPGIGKSTLARQFISLYRDEFHYVAWIDYDTSLKLSFVSNYQLIDSLHIAADLEKITDKGNYLDIAFDIVVNRLRQLKATDKKCLLVIDNFEETLNDQYLINKLQIGPQWKVMLTSRNPVPWTTEYVLEELSDKDSRALFASIYGKELSPDEEIVLDKILGHIENHTLLIELLAHSGERRLSNIYENLRNQPHKIKADSKFAIRHNKRIYVENLIGYIASIVDFSQFNDTDIDLLSQLAIMPSKFIPVEGDDEENLMGIISTNDAGRSQSLVSSIDNCISKGVLIESNQRSLLKMHRLIQLAVESHFGIHYFRCSPLIEFVHDKLDTGPAYKLASAKKWLQYADIILRKVPESNEMMAELWTRFGWYNCEFELFDDAIKAISKSIDLSRELIIPKLEAACLCNLASVRHRQNDNPEAVAVLRKAIEVVEDCYPAGHKEIALYRHNLSIILKGMQNYDEALEMAIICLRDTSHPNFERPGLRSFFLVNLAGIYNDLGLPYKALDELETCVKLIKKYDQDDFVSAHADYELGRAELLRGDKTLAEKHFQNAQKKFELSLGPDHAKTQMANEYLINL